MTSFSVLVSGNLNLDVTWLNNEFFHVNTIVSEGSTGFAFHHFPSALHFVFAVYHTHTLSTTACGSFQDNWINNSNSQLFRVVKTFNQSVATRNGRNTSIFHGLLCRRLVAHRVDHFRRSTNEFDSVFFTHLREGSVFRKETISRVNSICVGDLCSGNNVWNL